MAAKRKFQAQQELEIDMDTRIAGLWEKASDIEEWDLETVGVFMRAAYGQGYCDALLEAREDEEGKLLSDHGFSLPER